MPSPYNPDNAVPQGPLDELKIWTGDQLQALASFGIDPKTNLPTWANGAADPSPRLTAGRIVTVLSEMMTELAAKVEKVHRDPLLTAAGQRQKLQGLGQDALIAMAKTTQPAPGIRAAALAHHAELVRVLEPEGDAIMLEMRSRELREMIRTTDLLKVHTYLTDAASMGDKLLLRAVKTDPAKSFAPLATDQAVLEAENILLERFAPELAAEGEKLDSAVGALDNAIAAVRRGIMNLTGIEGDDPVLIRIAAA